MRSFPVFALALLSTVSLRSQPGIHPASARDGSKQPSASTAGPIGTSYLGVAVEPLDEEIANELRLPDGQGVLVRWVANGSPASKAGIKPNDIIVQFNGHDLNEVADLGRFVHEAPPGRKAKLKIFRDGKLLTTSITLSALRSPSVPPSGNSIRLDLAAPDFFTSDMPLPALLWRSNVLGIEYESIDAQLAAYFGVKQGLLVRYVLDRSPAQQAGVRAGDVLVEVARQQCASARDVGWAIRNRANPGKPVELEIVRDRKSHKFTVNLQGARNQALPE